MKVIEWSNSGASRKARRSIEDGESFKLVLAGRAAERVRANLTAGVMTVGLVGEVTVIVGLGIIMAVVAYAISKGYSVRLVFQRSPPRAVLVFKAPRRG